MSTNKRKYAVRPLKGNIERALEKVVNPADRRNAHNKAVVDAAKTDFGEFTRAGIRVVPSKAPHIDEVTGMVEVHCKFYDAETNVEIETPDGRIQMDRPPYRAPDGTWRRDGDRILPNVKEDPAEAIRLVLVSYILTTLRRPTPESVFPTEVPRYVTDDLGYRITQSGKVVPPPLVDGEWQPYGDPPQGETWKETE